MSASGRVLELTRSLHESVARMERSEIRERSIRLAPGPGLRCAPPGLQVCAQRGRRDHDLKKLSAASFDARFLVTAC